jgi:mannose-6-phosphate isomerase-like protein (cupin superfamily)
MSPPRSYQIERRALHAERPGFRIAEIQISPTQEVPWHCHSCVRDTFYVVVGTLRVFLRDPDEQVLLAPGDTYTVRVARAHRVTNAGTASATFLVLQGIGAHDFISVE